MKNIYDMVTNPNAKSYEDRLDRIFDEINTINSKTDKKEL